MLRIAGYSPPGWDDSFARLSFSAGIHATLIRAAGGLVAVLSPSGTVILYYASTCEEIRRLEHRERVLRMQFNLSGTLLVTYGYRRTKVWELPSGRCINSIQNPVERPRPHTIIITDDDILLVGSDDRKIRSSRPRDPAACWQTIADIDEQALEGTIVNSPTCMALSPDGTLVAVGYRGHPLSAWEVHGPDFIGHCLRVLDDSTQSHAEHAWGEVVQLTWHPYTGEVIGLYLEGVVFRWHPYHDETHEVYTGANSIAVSQDARCLATGDPNGIIKLYEMKDLKLVYQFASLDPVFDLSFAPDSRRLYDVRGSYANVWEPDYLLRLSEATGALVGDGTLPETLQLHSGKTDPVTALASQPNGRVYCSGSEDGLMEIFEASRTNVLELRKSKSFMSIELVVWSEDGRYVAFTDLSGRVFVTSVKPGNKSAGSLAIEEQLNLPVDVSKGSIRQILFDSQSATMLVYTGSSLCTISLLTKSIVNFQTLAKSTEGYKWINHPTNHELLLAFSPGRIRVRTWSTLVEVQGFTFPSAVVENTGSISRSQVSLSTNIWETKESINKILVTHDKTFVLVQSSFPAQHGQKQKEVIVLKVSDMACSKESSTSEEIKDSAPTGGFIPKSQSSSALSDSGSLNNEAVENLEPIQLPPELLPHIEIPLAFLSRDRLVFLNRDLWLCSWRLPLPSDSQKRRSSAPGTLDRGTMEIKQHYFFPSDWISPDSVRLCTVMADGTVLCPRNGGVAVVKCSTLRG